jgi:hypothetical protein
LDQNELHKKPEQPYELGTYIECVRRHGLGSGGAHGPFRFQWYKQLMLLFHKRYGFHLHFKL